MYSVSQAERIDPRPMARETGDHGVERARIVEIVRRLGLGPGGIERFLGIGKATASRYARGQIGDVKGETVRRFADRLGLSEWVVRGREPLPRDWPKNDPELLRAIDAVRLRPGRPKRVAPVEMVALPKEELASLTRELKEMREMLERMVRSKGRHTKG